MRRWTLTGLLVLPVLGLIGASALWGCSGGSDNAVQSGLPNGAITREQVLRGRYLVTAVAACSDCHGGNNDPNSANWLAGYTAGSPNGSFQIGPFKTYAANLTADPTTGLGNWTAQDIYNALHNGKDKDGKYLPPPMPWTVFRNMTDADLWAIAAYLKSLKPISNAVPASQGPPGADGKPDWSGSYQNLPSLPAYPAGSEVNVP